MNNRIEKLTILLNNAHSFENNRMNLKYELDTLVSIQVEVERFMRIQRILKLNLLMVLCNYENICDELHLNL